MKTSNTLLVASAVFLFAPGLAVTSPGAVFDQEIPARKTDEFQQAIFRLWVPDASGPVQE